MAGPTGLSFRAGSLGFSPAFSFTPAGEQPRPITRVPNQRTENRRMAFSYPRPIFPLGTFYRRGLFGSSTRYTPLLLTLELGPQLAVAFPHFLLAKLPPQDLRRPSTSRLGGGGSGSKSTRWESGNPPGLPPVLKLPRNPGQRSPFQGSHRCCGVPGDQLVDHLPPAGLGRRLALSVPSENSFLARPTPSRLPPQDPVQRIRRLVDQRLRVVRVGVEVLERQITPVADLVERLDHRRPVRRPVEQRPERLQRMVGPLLGEFLEVNVLDPLSQKGNPVLGELEKHDVAGVKMDPHVLALEAVHEGIHLLRGQKV